MQGFVLDTSEGQLFRAPGALFGEAHETNVHSGFLVGIWGSADSSGVHSQALCMLDDIDEVYIDMEYLSLRQSGISDVSVDNVTLDNRQSERDGEIVFKNEESVTNSATTPKAWAESLGVSASVSGKVFGIGTEGSTEYTPTEETMESTSYFRTRKTGMDTKVGVPGGKRYKVFFFFFLLQRDVQHRVQAEVFVQSAAWIHCQLASGQRTINRWYCINKYLYNNPRHYSCA